MTDFDDALPSSLADTRSNRLRWAVPLIAGVTLLGLVMSILIPSPARPVQSSCPGYGYGYGYGQPGAVGYGYGPQGIPFVITAGPATPSNPVGTTVLVLATVEDCAGNPVPDVSVEFEVTVPATTGETPASGTDTTGGNGRAAFSFTSTKPGATLLEARVEGFGGQTLQDSIVATWSPGPAASLALAPPTATNPVGTPHLVTATVTDGFGNAVPGASVGFTAAGTTAELPASGSALTDANGAATFSFSSLKAGTSTVTATSGAASATATKIWTAGPAATLALEPATAANQVGSAHTVVATVRDAAGNAIADAPVTFTAGGTGGEIPASGSGTTGTDGTASFTFTSSVAGASAITATSGAASSTAIAQWSLASVGTPGLGYWLFAADGGVFTFGGAPFFGSVGSLKLNSPIVAMDSLPNQLGYWLFAADGGVFAFGDAAFQGSTGGIKLNKPIVAGAATPSGLGYWLVASDGGVFAFGDAAFHGSTGGISLNSPIVGMAATPTGLGYWLFAADGGTFAFGDASFHGSTGGIKLNKPITAAAGTPSGLGYWLAASDGGVFAFGDAAFHGSTGGIKLNSPIAGMTPTQTGMGYWMSAADGGVFAFGDASFLGSLGSLRLNSPIIGMAGLGV